MSKKTLIIFISEDGHTEKVMDHLRPLCVKGGTVIHGKSPLTDQDEKFFKITIHPKRDLLLIACLEDQKHEIMREIYNNFGKGTEANGIVFSLEIDKTIGVRLQWKKKKRFLVY